MSKIKCGIIDLNINNIHSIYHASKKIGLNTKVINDKIKSLKDFDMIILPGVGSFKKAMKKIEENGIKDKILEFNQNQKFIFGICLGMQLLFQQSEEFGKTKGIGLLEGEVLQFKKNNKNKIPHIGWYPIKTNNSNKFIKDFKNKYFYFVHSYYCKPKKKNFVETETKFNNFYYASSVFKDNIYATQFHPEKSGPQGLKFLKSIKNRI